MCQYTWRSIGILVVLNQKHCLYVARSDDITSLEYSRMSEMCSGDVTYPVTIVIDQHESPLRLILARSLV